MKALLTLCLILFGLWLYPPKGAALRVPDAEETAHAIQARHADTWNVRECNHLYCYLVAKPRPEEVWGVPGPLSNGTVEEIAKCPFEAEAWEKVVLVRLYQNPDGPKHGWYGAAFVKGAYLFYGDRRMIEQIDRDLP